MKTIAPDYYRDFACIADQCRHSCCQGWEIDIDADSLARYRHLSGIIGEELRQYIETDGETAHFRLDSEERCPFLNAQGLCRLILTCGEDALCQICTDHPRFRSFFTDRTEIGLGLCCEAACHLILCRQEPMTQVALDDDGAKEELSDAERTVLAIRTALIQTAQNRAIPVSQRVGRLKERLNVPEYDWKREAERLLKLERMDETWTVYLENLQSGRRKYAAFSETPEWEIAQEQLLVYFFYRHIPTAEEEDEAILIARRMLYLWELARVLCQANAERQGRMPTIADFEDVCRLLSSELEYSEENMDVLLWDWEETV